MVKLSYNPDGSFALGDYEAIIALHFELEQRKIPHEFSRLFDGWQICYPNKESKIGDAVEHFGSWGAEEDLIEVWGFDLEDHPMGWLTMEEALDYFDSWNREGKKE